MTLLFNEEENNLEVFAKYQHFDLEFNEEEDDIPWKIPTLSKQIKRSEPKIGKNN